MRCSGEMQVSKTKKGCGFIWTLLSLQLAFMIIVLDTLSEAEILPHDIKFRLDFGYTSGIYPSVMNLARNATITANATCGQQGPEKYCKLVEHVDKRWMRRSRQCSICYGASPILSEQHSIQNAIDGRADRWWQSPTIQQGYTNHWITIIIDLKQMFQVAYVIVKAANSPRPGNWILERSLDGIHWDVWQFFAVSDSECMKTYGLPASPPGPPRYRYDTEVTCTSYFSQLIPLQNGEIHISLIRGRPSAENPNQELTKFTSARYIRLRFQKIRTLHGDLMTMNYRRPEYVDPVVTRRYYYSIKDISIGGMCICYGHASHCPANFLSGEYVCSCDHHTTGVNCEICEPGFNQYKWQPGNNGFVCEACNCHGHASECFYDPNVERRRKSQNKYGEFSGGGVCVDCKDNTAGINCETCVDGFFRSVELDPDAENPCSPCSCNSFGGIQIPDSNRRYFCVKDITFSNVQENLIPGDCICKNGYAGSKCDRCAIGYRGFPRCEACRCNVSGSLNRDPCEGECICKKNVIGSECFECKPGFFNLHRSNPTGCDQCFCFGVTSFCISSTLRWLNFSTNYGWELRAKNARRRIQARLDEVLKEPYVEHKDVVLNLGSTIYYWSAPEEYLGNKLSSYGGYLRYIVSYDIPKDQRPVQLQETDVIIEGNGKTLLYNYIGIRFKPGVDKVVALKLYPPTEINDPTRWINAETLMPATKADLMEVLIDVRRLLIRAVYSRNSEMINRIRDVRLDFASETGNGEVASAVEVCQCPPGYSGLSCEKCKPGYWRNNNQCIPCQCYGHSSTCNQLNGACEKCNHNTMGLYCERCKPGFYGDATWGTINDCRSCSCPLPIPSNNFSPTCRFDRTSSDVICTQCLPGYTGKKCEYCQDGFFGQPTIPGNSCQPCKCNDNSLSCDRETGKCKSCEGYTAGTHCERCKTGFFGDAIVEKNCRPCACNLIGSLSRLCNPVTGQCSCANGVYGRSCNECTDNHYLSAIAKKCISCDCSRVGSVTMQCRPDGTCRCKNGVTGRLCEACDRGFYGFSQNGCSECHCGVTNGNCEPYTGECVCPLNTNGHKCSECIDGSYRWDREAGCKECECYRFGSVSQACNNVTGLCQCKEQYGGKNCDQCKDGYFGFPNCRPCRCNRSGSESTSCNASKSSLCNCSNDGKCFCKANTRGKRCNQCAPNSFGMSVEHPQGCASCYCSGVTKNCTHANFVWGPPISLSVATVKMLNQTSIETLMTQDLVALSSNFFLINLQMQPYYWRLPEKFTGNKSLSYSGNLRYTIRYHSEASAAPVAFLAPSVIISGGIENNKTIQFQNEDPLSQTTKSYVVPMREFGWTDVDNGKNITRKEFADILMHIKYILIRASYGYLMQQSKLSDVFLDVAIPDKFGRGDVSYYAPANGLEKCFCPPGYLGLSCQDCAPGYMRTYKYPNSHLCEPCDCNGRSDICSVETGKCLNCIGEFTGRHCERCKDGYYLAGDVCRKCTCPGGSAENNFSPTCHSVYLDDSIDYICDACRPGYEGKRCERCADGYYGNLTTPGSFCAKCGCNVAGSVDAVCNKITGQCHCDTGISGRICNQCDIRHVISAQGCVECNDRCSGTLLFELDNLIEQIKTVNFSKTFPLPWNRLEKAKNNTAQFQINLSNMSNNLINKRKAMKKITRKNIDVLKKRLSTLKPQSKVCVNDAKTILTKTKLNRKHSRKLKKEAKDLIDLVENTERSIYKLANQLQANSIPDLDTMRIEVEDWIEKIKSRNLSSYLALANQDIKASEKLRTSLNKNLFIKSETNYTAKKENLYKKFDDVFRKLNDTVELNNQIERLLNATKAKNQMNRQNLRQTKGKIEKISNEFVMAGTIVEEGSELLKNAKKLYESGTNYTNVLNKVSVKKIQMIGSDDSFNSFLINVRNQLQKLLDTDLNPAPKNEMMTVTKEVEDKKNFLNESAEYIVKVQNEITVNFLNQTEGVLRWSKIYNTIDKSDKLAGDAIRIASQSLSNSRQNLQSKAVLSFGRSDQVFRNVMAQKVLIDEHNKQLLQLNEELAATNNSAKKLKRKYESLRSEMQGTKSGFFSKKPLLSPESVQVEIQASMHVVAEAENQFSSVQRVYQQLDVAFHNMENHQMSIKKTEDFLTETPMELASVRNDAALAMVNSERVGYLSKKIQKNISHIRKLIEDTKQKVSSIRLPVKSDGKCSMMYKPEISSARTTEITLNVKTSVPNNILFLLFREQEDYIAIETREYQVRVTWNLGGGPGVVQHPVTIKAEEPSDWFTIDINRHNQHLNLTVYKKANTAEPKQTVSGRSRGKYAILDIEQGDRLFVGGVTDDITLPRTVLYRSFTGCMGETYLQGKNIGLWKFFNISNSEHCKSCILSKDDDTRNKDKESFGFSGRSYAVLKLPPNYKKDRTKFSFKFMTFSSDALMLYLGSKSRDDFCSVEMHNGQVVIKFDFGDGFHVLRTKEQYNTGEWFTLTVYHRFFNVRFDIRKEGKLQERDELRIEDGSDASLDLDENDVFTFGGYQNEIFLKKYVTRTSLIGCVRGFTFLKHEIHLSSLIGNEFLLEKVGISNGCFSKETYNIGIGNEGYVQLPPRNFTPSGLISITFNTLEPSCILLLATNEKENKNRKDQRHDLRYYSIYLRNGTIHARIQLSSKNYIVLSSRNKNYNNGKTHSVSLFRKSAKIVLQMNEDEKDTVTRNLERNAARTVAVRQLFVGGVPKVFSMSNAIARVQNSLNGCVRELLIDNIISFNDALKTRNVFIGNCQFVNFNPLSTSSPAIPTAIPNESTPHPNDGSVFKQYPTKTIDPTCRKTGNFSVRKNSVNFGSSVHSHLIFKLKQNLSTRFSFEMKIRTRGKSGLILYADHLSYQDFFALKLKDGKPGFQINNGLGTVEVFSLKAINDGHWHKIRIKRIRRRGWLTIDKGSVLKLNAKKGASQMDVRNLLFVGGLPKDYDRKTVGQINNSMDVCIQNLKLNKKNKLNPIKAFSSYKVQSCFSRVGPGAYFNGRGYITQKSNFRVGPALRIEMKFRTWRSHGVLMSVEKNELEGIGLELINGSIYFRANNGDGMFETYIPALPDERNGNKKVRYPLCDGKWHVLMAEKVRTTLRLSVDDFNATSTSRAMAHSADTYHPLYIGGIPNEVAMPTFLRTRERFEGCMKNVMIKNRTPIDFNNSVYRNAVFPDACPISKRRKGKNRKSSIT